MITTTKAEIEKSLIEIIEDLVQDWGLDLNGGITGKTLLANDLEFASVDIIQLCVAIEEHYDRKFGFQDLLMQNGSYVTDLAVTQWVDFLDAKLQGGQR